MTKDLNTHDSDMEVEHPNEAEVIVLTLLYNRFYDLYDEITDDNFLAIDAELRLLKVKEAFSAYKELLQYEPIKWVLTSNKAGRRPMSEAFIEDDLFSFIRNLLSHFPVFKCWDEIFINKKMANWSKPGQIDRFLNKCASMKIGVNGVVKYRMWDPKKHTMTYLSINFPTNYGDENIYLRDIITEQDGIKFCMVLMKQIIDTQIALIK